MNENQKYSRVSFDRFGDDLVEEILSELKLSDCFVFECVSKQFQRLLYSGHNELDTKSFMVKTQINGKIEYGINKTALECALRKCSFINEITISGVSEINEQIIYFIINNCSQLKSIVIANSSLLSISLNSWQLFGEKFGNSLRTICFVGNIWEFDNQNIGITNESMRALLRLTPNLVECETFCFQHFIVDTNQWALVLPKLKKIAAIVDSNSDFRSFADQYSHRIETLVVKGLALIQSNDEMSAMFGQLSRFKRLQVLKLENIASNRYDGIKFGLHFIANNCEQLREIYAESGTAIFDVDRPAFVSLRRLTLCMISYDELDFQVCQLRCCPHLTTLKVLGNFWQLSAEQFAAVDSYLPKLRCIQIECREGVQHILQSLAALKELQCIRVRIEVVCVTDEDVREFLNRCQSIRRIEFNKVANLSRQTVNAFVSHAKLGSKYTKFKYELRANFLNDGESITETEMKAVTSDLPNNISIDINRDIRFRNRLKLKVFS